MGMSTTFLTTAEACVRPTPDTLVRTTFRYDSALTELELRISNLRFMTESPGKFCSCALTSWTTVFTELKYVAFVDSGYAAGSIDEAISEMRMSAGFGIRFYPGFGPIRFDIATPLDRQEGEDPVQIYVSIGQAF